MSEVVLMLIEMMSRYRDTDEIFDNSAEILNGGDGTPKGNDEGLNGNDQVVRHNSETPKVGDEILVGSGETD